MFFCRIFLRNFARSRGSFFRNFEFVPVPKNFRFFVRRKFELRSLGDFIQKRGEIYRRNCRSRGRKNFLKNSARERFRRSRGNFFSALQKIFRGNFQKFVGFFQKFPRARNVQKRRNFREFRQNFVANSVSKKLLSRVRRVFAPRNFERAKQIFDFDFRNFQERANENFAAFLPRNRPRSRKPRRSRAARNAHQKQFFDVRFLMPLKQNFRVQKPHFFSEKRQAPFPKQLFGNIFFRAKIPPIERFRNKFEAERF